MFKGTWVNISTLTINMAIFLLISFFFVHHIYGRIHFLGRFSSILAHMGIRLRESWMLRRFISKRVGAKASLLQYIISTYELVQLFLQ